MLCREEGKKKKRDEKDFRNVWKIELYYRVKFGFNSDLIRQDLPMISCRCAQSSLSSFKVLWSCFSLVGNM